MLTRRQLLSAGGGAIVGASPLVAAAPATARVDDHDDQDDRDGGRVVPGAERFVEGAYADFSGARLGLVTNPTGVLANLAHEVDVMVGMGPDVDLAAVFGPEHGFRGTEQAGGSEGYHIDPRTGLPVYDTYLKRGQALADAFTQSGVDVVMFDIQDVGARFYTFIWTMFDCMEAAVLAGKAFVVLDRPNPIGGREAEGPVLDPEYATFVGRQPIAQRHGMTVAELAQLFNGEFLPSTVGAPVELTAIKMRGWHRRRHYGDTGLPWVPPSPNMPTPDTALVYPGTCLFEGTNLSEGRGTTRPFELIGAPFIDGAWADTLRATDLRGVGFREAYFRPTFSKYTNVTVGGVQLVVTDAQLFDPIRTALTMIVTAKQLVAEFAWRFDTGDPVHPYWIDKLTGSDYVRTAIDAGASADEVVEGWQDDLAGFEEIRRRYLLY